MKARIWFYLGIPVFIGATMLVASQHSEKRLPPDQRIWFTIPGKYVGRALTTEERATIQEAIDDIRIPPPSSFTYKDAFLDTHTVSCEAIADSLQKQLDRRAMEAETLNQKIYGATLLDGKKTTEGDQMNINPEVIRLAGENPMGLTMLKIVLVHEYIHKTQCTEETTPDEREIEALTAELAYMDSLGMDTTDAFYRATWGAHWALWYNYVTDTTRSMRYMPLTWTQDHFAFIRFDSTETGPDYFVSFGLGDPNCYEYDLSPMQASDMLIFDNYFQFPAGHSLALICGGEPALGQARILALDIFQGQVVNPFDTLDFGPPTYPPMFLRSLTRCIFSGLYFAINAANEAEHEEIVTMSDNNYDFIPESIISTYASSSWPGFEDLEGMRGVDVAGYSFFRGFGLLVNHDDVHLPHEMDPYATYLFLPDANYDRIADACESVYAYEFLYFTPHVQVPLPLGGDQAVQLFATWMDNIEIWKSDSLGQNLSELLGSVQMTNGVDAECPLSRVLQEGEFILPVDQTTGQRPGLATRVGSGTATDETIPLLPAQFALLAPFPNPFNASTTISYDLPKSGNISLRVFDLLGREVAVLKDGFAEAGSHRVLFDGSGLATGIYFARLEAGEFSQTRKLMLLR